MKPNFSPSGSADTLDVKTSAVIVRDLWMSFPGKNAVTAPIHVLENINAAVAPGEFVCLVGPSGCGKSTLLNIIGGFLAATAR